MHGPRATPPPGVSSDPAEPPCVETGIWEVPDTSPWGWGGDFGRSVGRVVFILDAADPE